MRVDVSEIKTYRECKRKHFLSSRNRLHLKPIAPNDNLFFGTVFHQCLHMLYAGAGENLDDVHKYIDDTLGDSEMHKMMCTMINGYFDGPLQDDLNRYEVLDIEHSFDFEIAPDIHVCGSIDMIVKDKTDGKIYGFEHKSGKNFRPDIYDLIDEQPRIYFIALQRYAVNRAISPTTGELLAPAQLEEVGGIILNQVKKLKTQFQYKRTTHRYSDDDLTNFMASFEADAHHIYNEDEPELPSPSFMKCQMCDYASICQHFGYESLSTDKVMQEFEGEYVVREVDHLDEKQELWHGND